MKRFIFLQKLLVTVENKLLA